MTEPAIATEAPPEALPVNNSGRLKYADPRSLPSFPSSGLKSDGAAAGAAASLGWSNQKPIELWKPDKLSSASAAAVLATDYKMAPQWQPSANSDGHKAALLAVGSASSALKQNKTTEPAAKGQHDGWGNTAATHAFRQPSPRNEPTDEQPISGTHGSTAATQAFAANRTDTIARANAPSPQVAPADRPLAAAMGAMALNRPRSTSSPMSPASASGDNLQSRAASNALSGASVAHRASMRPKPTASNGGAVPVTTMTRNMFTSHPMVKPEVDERNDAERLHQSAVEMAKKMYNQQQKMVEQAKARGEDPDKFTSPYLSLQDAAYKQAQDRLSKLEDEYSKNRNMQEYYGNTQAPAPRRRWSVANKLRRRDSDENFDDREESQRIRQQMSMFSNKLTEVDQAKRQSDRDALLAAAQRNVKARLHGMDEKVYNDTGKINPALHSDWNLKAQQAAQLSSDARNENTGKLNLGGGMYMDQEQIDAIAAKRMQPVLDDINEKAEKERARQAVLKAEEEARKAELAREKERDREAKALSKRIRDEDKEEQKARKMQAKEEERAKKEQEKAEKAEQKRLAKEGKRRSKVGTAADDQEEETAPADTARVSGDDAILNDEVHPAMDAEDRDADVVPPIDSTLGDPPSPEAAHSLAAARSGADEEHQDEQHEVDQDEHRGDHRHSSGSKLKGWIKNRLSRGRSMSERDGDAADEEKKKKRTSFFKGSGALKKDNPNASNASLEQGPSSMRDVAIAGHADGEASHAAPERDSRGVSPVSSVARDEAPDRLEPPKPIGERAPRASVSPGRDSRFREEM
ncbi:uncharacterized protein F5Z01DRAFT_685601 [Emericellopsis atlantica]|uniref:Eisosome protein 1 n=1 Tax=Emericellopsis atlantica TaxID=2614577 RepID=A0A9P7ZN77_9HYPO|nr:uncharacterized protein F5Z01DRAFT_685601 [Emericellopsis atlantica]KAG9255233.1 hypothetical protein F5Z01DRAFT_685601 [Emericellopsis atlantica]